jgi:protein SCO1/2
LTDTDQTLHEPPSTAERRTIWRSPFFWAAVAGLVLIPAMRPFLRFEPDPPPVLGQLPKFELVNSSGEPFGSSELEGRVWVANFIFTRCASICPLLTDAMSRLDRRFVDEGIDGIHLVSFTVDPEFDTPEVLRNYGELYGIESDRWSLVTGSPDAIRAIVEGGFKTAMGSPDTGEGGLIDVAHTGKFVLVDGSGGIRGYYDTDAIGLDEIFHRSQHVLNGER